MPGSVTNASPSSVLPRSLCTGFVENRAWASRVNEYNDGSRQSSALVATSRRAWTLRKRLTAAQVADLWAFWTAHQHTAFYFYNPFEPASGQLPGSNYDQSGASIVGRYTVRFDGEWNQTMTLGRTDCEINLIEVA